MSVVPGLEAGGGLLGRLLCPRLTLPSLFLLLWSSQWPRAVQVLSLSPLSPSVK